MIDDLKELLGKVTPGPWFIDGIAVSGDGLDVCFMGEPAQCAGDTANMLLNYDDNARLIAMAPDLAAEVLRLRAALERIGKTYQCDGNRLIHGTYEIINIVQSALERNKAKP